MKYISFIALFILTQNTFAQKDQTIYFGVNVGVKFANKNYAQRYAGYYPSSGFTGNLENTLMLVNNYNQIYAILGEKNFFFPNDGYPTKIKYTPGLITGVTIGYQLSPSLQAGIDANFSKLKVKDFFTLEVIDPSNTTSQEQYSVGSLYAEESRFNGRFNFDYIIEGDKLNYIIGLSGLFSAWRIDEHIAVFQDYIMPLHSKHNPNNNFSTRVSGMGWGGGINGGLEYRFTEKIVCQLMYQPYVQRTDYYNTKLTIESLGSSYIKDKFRLEHDLTLRILWK